MEDIALFNIDQPCSARALHSHYDPSQLKNVIPFIFNTETQHRIVFCITGEYVA